MTPSVHSRHTVVVQFKGNGRKYHYLTWRGDIEIGNTVVIKTTHAGLLCVQVVDVLWNTTTQDAFKYIVDKVDEDAYDRYMMRIDNEREAEQRRFKRINDLEQELAKRRQAVEAQLIDERMKTDPNVQILVQELKQLKGEI